MKSDVVKSLRLVAACLTAVLILANLGSTSVNLIIVTVHLPTAFLLVVAGVLGGLFALRYRQRRVIELRRRSNSRTQTDPVGMPSLPAFGRAGVGMWDSIITSLGYAPESSDKSRSGSRAVERPFREPVVRNEDGSSVDFQQQVSGRQSYDRA